MAARGSGGRAGMAGLLDLQGGDPNAYGDALNNQEEYDVHEEEEEEEEEEVQNQDETDRIREVPVARLSTRGSEVCGGNWTGRGKWAGDTIAATATILTTTTPGATESIRSQQISSTSITSTARTGITATTATARVTQPQSSLPSPHYTNPTSFDTQTQTPTRPRKRKQGFYISGVELKGLGIQDGVSAVGKERDVDSSLGIASVRGLRSRSLKAGSGVSAKETGSQETSRKKEVGKILNTGDLVQASRSGCTGDSGTGERKGKEKSAGKIVETKAGSLDGQEEGREDQIKGVKGLGGGKGETVLGSGREKLEVVESAPSSSNTKEGEVEGASAGLRTLRESSRTREQLQRRESVEGISAKTGSRLRIQSGDLEKGSGVVDVHFGVEAADSRSAKLGVGRSKSRRSSEVERLREGQPALASSLEVEQQIFGSVSGKGFASSSGSRRSSEAQLVNEDQTRSSSQSSPDVETLHQSIEDSQPQFARPAKRKSDTFGDEEGESSLSRAKSVKFHHPTDELSVETPSRASHRSGSRKSELEYLLDAQAGTPFQLPVGFEGSSGRSLRSQSVVGGVKDVASLELETVKPTVVHRPTSTVPRVKSRVVSEEEIVAAQPASVTKTVATQTKKPPLKRAVSTRNRTSSPIVVETAPFLQASRPLTDEDSIEVDATNKKIVQRIKSGASSSGSIVATAGSVRTKAFGLEYEEADEESIIVEAPKKKVGATRSKSQVQSSKLEESLNLQFEVESVERTQPQLINSGNESSIQVESSRLEARATVSRSTSRAVSASKVHLNSPVGAQSVTSRQASSENSIEVEPVNAKSRVRLLRSEVVPNLLGKSKTVAKVQEKSKNDEQNLQVQGPKANPPRSRTKSRAVSAQSSSDLDIHNQAGRVVEKVNTVAKQKTIAPKPNPTATQAVVTANHLFEYPYPSSQADKASSRVQSQEIDISNEETNENSELPPNTICITKLLTDADIKRTMPDLDESVLTRARRRAEGPRGDRLISRRRSSSHKISGLQRVNLVNETRAASSVAETPSTVPLPTKPSSPNYIEVDSTQSHSNAPSKSGETSSKNTSKAKEKDKPLERNIDNVIFENVTFKAWYPSWYPKEIIGEKGLNGDCKGIVVPDLYVCKRCFGYAKTAVDWVRHTRCCEKDVPGEKVYTHGPDAIWSIWEVDGDVDTLYCQNLSLFAKLFLDNKSVFFDVSGFKYFLLVHTSPLTSSNHVVGFFSKEKMSWDNNNLACILVFPPWQRKSLGTLLMGISYAISKREQILGGPEKPISDLGKKGYKRYWGAEIARWLLSVKESDKKKGRGMVTVGDVSQGTWIVAEDCLTVLREMGVVEKAGRGKGVVERVRVDKEAVRRWVAENGVKLERVVDEAGFREGYALEEREEGGEGDVEMVG